MKVRLPTKVGKGGNTGKGRKGIQALSREAFAADLIKAQEGLDFHMSARGWCYALEPYGLSKADFRWAAREITALRELGLLKPEFILEDEAHEVEVSHDYEISPQSYVDYKYKEWQEAAQEFRNSASKYTDGYVSFWGDKDCYIQMLVEKVDLKSLFRSVCERYHISIANMRGWGTLEQKAVVAQRFAEMEAKGKRPVLLVCADFDPAGLGISGKMKDSFKRQKVFNGWDPANLEVCRVGLNYEFIIEQSLSWINNLKTAQGKDLADPKHKHYIANINDVQGYIKKYGVRKCEANAIVVAPELGQQMLEAVIQEYVGKGALKKYEQRVQDRREEVQELIDERLEGGDDE